MVSRKLVATALLALPLTVIGFGRASAQATTPPAKNFQPHVIETTFPFDVGGKTVPAGKYEVEQTAPTLLVFRPASGKGAIIEAPVLTRLARPLTPITTPYVIFDKVNDSYFISEVWLPAEDGFLLGGIKEEHTHQRVKATKK